MVVVGSVMGGKEFTANRIRSRVGKVDWGKKKDYEVNEVVFYSPPLARLLSAALLVK